VFETVPTRITVDSFEHNSFFQYYLRYRKKKLLCSNECTVILVGTGVCGGAVG
jgi:hypothetical protein